jgi:hypothetical protein
MAIRPADEYPAQTIDSDPGYPEGKARNVTVSGDNTGTPLDELWVNDMWGFFQALLAAAGITPSGDPDEVGASDYLDATQAVAADVADTQIQAAVDAEALTYTAPPSRTVMIGYDAGVGQSGWATGDGDPSGSSQFRRHATGNLERLQIDITPYVPSGGVVTSVSALVKPGAARASSSRIEFVVYSLLSGGPFPGTDPEAASSETSVIEDDGTTGRQRLTAAMTFTPTVDQSNMRLMAVVRSGSTASTNNDLFYGLEVTFDDPGPRNY